MARTLIFDAQFKNSSGTAIDVDGDIYVELFEVGNPTRREMRVLGPDPDTTIFKTADAAGTLYTTSVDVSDYTPGNVTAKWYAKLGGVPTLPYPFEESLAYPLGNTLSASEVKDYIRNQLGWPAVAVELTGSHYRTIIEETLATYNQWLPVERFGALNLVPGVYRYPLTEVGTRGVYHVEFLRRIGTPLVSDPLFGREFPRGNVLDFDTFILALSNWGILNRITSNEPMWEWEPATQTLWVNIGTVIVMGPVGSYLCMYRYYQDTDLNSIRQDHHRWFRRYALSQAKKILARVRGKYGGQVPTPSGMLTLDADTLREEGNAEEEKLLQEVRSMMPPVPPVLG